MYAAGNSTGMGHTYKEESYWKWVADVGEETLFVFEEKRGERQYDIAAKDLFYMGNKSAGEDRLLGVRLPPRLTASS